MSRLSIEKINISVGSFKVSDVTLTIKDHQYFVLMGPTGSGKSLLLKAICGLIPVDSGSISLNETDITHFQPRFRKIGYVPQDSGLFPHLNVKENIIFAPIIKGKNETDAMAMVDKVVKSLEITHLLERTVTNLSGGEKQKVALARALARNPQLLILDEPVSAVDEPTRKEICKILTLIQQEFRITTIHVCHSREEARFVSDNIGIMSEGRLRDVGKIADLTRNPGHPETARLLQD